MITVSIHAPARGATILPENFFLLTQFQSTPPRGGRRQGADEFVLVRDVSIHAPARGATRWRCYRTRLAGVSIHAPARGATGYG